MSKGDPSVRIRGIYTTALTARWLDRGCGIVDPSPPIADRFDEDFHEGPADVTVRSSADDLGVGLHGPPAAVADLAEDLATLGSDTFVLDDPLAVDTIVAGTVDRTNEGGAILELPDGEGFLPFRLSDGYVDEGDEVLVHVLDAVAPWRSDRRPVLSMIPRVEGHALAVTAGSVDERTDEELATVLDRLGVAVPDAVSVTPEGGAGDRSIGALTAELDAALERLAGLSRRMEREETGATTRTTTWVRFGREARFAMDDLRSEVTPTIEGHHRIKLTGSGGSTAVDFAELLVATDWSFDADAVLDTFGPELGDRVAIRHGKPTGQSIELGRGTVVNRPMDEAVTVRRALSGGGTYDGLDVPKEEGDVAETTFVEGRWWYPTMYKDADGRRKGTYVNVCTPIELLPSRVEYVDLYVDVLKTAEDEVSIVDNDELEAAVDAGHVAPDLGERARDVAARLADAL